MNATIRYLDEMCRKLEDEADGYKRIADDKKRGRKERDAAARRAASVVARREAVADVRFNLSHDLVPPEPIPLILTCPACKVRHIDVGKFATKPHHTHACQHCGLTWRPAVVPTIGVQFLPGFRNDPGVR